MKTLSQAFQLLRVLIICSITCTLNAQSVISVKKTDIEVALDSAYTRYKSNTEGTNADYIPALAEVPSELYGIVLVTADGRMFKTGDVDYNFFNTIHFKGIYHGRCG